MKALTIHQPYAELIACGEKRVENRGWSTAYRGPLLIHAGKSRKWLALDRTGKVDASGRKVAEMAFGAIIAQAEVIDCVRLGWLKGQVAQVVVNGKTLVQHAAFERRVVAPEAAQRHPWLSSHPHAEGPYCFVLGAVRRFERPIPWRGLQGLFEVPDEALADGVLLPPHLSTF